MKLLSVVIPCYNSESYLGKCIESLLIGDEAVEIIIVNDGSKDGTAAIAEKYRESFPTIVKTVHQENKGHGGAVNTGLRNASGLYFKVVDSDDWVDKEAYVSVLSTLKHLVDSSQAVDLFICNYVFEKQGAEHKKVMDYKGTLPSGEVFTWDDVKRFDQDQYIIMHSAIYRTQLLRECGLKLPEHIFYEDIYFVYQPLPYVKNMYYLDVDFYRYFIGRKDQSVNDRIRLERIDQQIKITKLVIDTYDIQEIENKHLRKYMIRLVGLMMAIPSVYLIQSGTDENLEKKQDLWSYLEEKDKKLYRQICLGVLGIGMRIPGEVGRKVTIAGYKLGKWIYGYS
jgi:glycosyltransferase involved in cell wall biosynthesis